jgi:REP element-mobilizing transposase RayT
MKKLIREKKHRLDQEVYKGLKIISFTLCIKNRKILFKNPQIFKVFESLLIKELNKHQCQAYVYLFMPDHAHLLVSGKEQNSDNKRCIDSFKQKSGYCLYNNLSDFKWQKDYYDHILRKEEELKTQIEYILNNPVRAGLVEEWRNYKFKGSTVYSIDEWE